MRRSSPEPRLPSPGRGGRTLAHGVSRGAKPKGIPKPRRGDQNGRPSGSRRSVFQNQPQRDRFCCPSGARIAFRPFTHGSRHELPFCSGGRPACRRGGRLAPRNSCPSKPMSHRTFRRARCPALRQARRPPLRHRRPRSPVHGFELARVRMADGSRACRYTRTSARRPLNEPLTPAPMRHGAADSRSYWSASNRALSDTRLPSR